MVSHGSAPNSSYAGNTPSAADAVLGPAIQPQDRHEIYSIIYEEETNDFNVIMSFQSAPFPRSVSTTVHSFCRLNRNLLLLNFHLLTY